MASATVRSLSLTGLLLAVASDPRAPAQEEDAFRYKPFLDLIASKYIPAPPSGKQTLELTIDFSPDLPPGTKLHFDLIYNSLPLDGETVIYELKGTQRKAVLVKWQPKHQLAPDDYFFQAQLDLIDQVDSVRAALEKKKDVFPPEFNPLIWHFLHKEKAIKIGTPEERAVVEKALCDFYDRLIGELVQNWNEYKKSMDAFEAGEEFRTKDGQVDPDALQAYIKEWRKKQAKTQKTINLDFQVEQPVLHARSMTAHLHLLRLGRMVSRRSLNLERRLVKDLNLKPIDIKVDPKDDSDQVLRHFDAVFRFSVDADALNKTMDSIYRLVCPAVEEEVPQGEAGSPAGDGPKGDAPDEKGSGEEPKKTPEKKNTPQKE